MRLTKLMQISDHIRDWTLGVAHYSFAMFFDSPDPYYVHMSQEGAVHLAKSADIHISYAKGTEGYLEEQAAHEELKQSARYDLNGNER